MVLLVNDGGRTAVLMMVLVNDRFYYDFFSREKQMTDGDLKLIKKEMEKIIKQKLPLLREEVTRCANSKYKAPFKRGKVAVTGILWSL